MAGQTLADIRALLAAHGLAPRHRYGQNFLIDLNLMRKLVDASEVGGGDVVLEVGPGTGSLTELLLERGARVIAAEIDTGLADLLQQRLGHQPGFTLVRGDALETKHAISPALLAAVADAAGASGEFSLVANLPYQIATPLLIELLVLPPPRCRRMSFTIQREVGLRIQAAPRSGDYGPLAVVVQTLATVRTIARLPPSVFWPQPQVDSVMMQIEPLGSPPVEWPARFAAFVQRGFQQRRKMLRRGLDVGGQDIAVVLTGAQVSGENRPEELTPTEWQRLYEVVVRP